MGDIQKDIKNDINKYIIIKPKYYNRDEINEIIKCFKKVEEYINILEIENKRCKCVYLEKENEILKYKLKNIKTNLENIGTGKKYYDDDIKEKQINMNNILLFLNKNQNNKNIFIRFFIYLISTLIYYIYYAYKLINNNKN